MLSPQAGRGETAYAVRKHNLAISRHVTPELCWKIQPSPNRGRRAIPRGTQGRPGARCTRGLACKWTKRRAHEHTGSAEAVRPSLRNGFTAYFVLSLATGFLSPSSLRSLLLKNLTPASGRQNHTTSPSASAPFVKGTSASTASRSTSVTIAKRPSYGTGWRRISR